jgi:hypothetical protein
MRSTRECAQQRRRGRREQQQSEVVRSDSLTGPGATLNVKQKVELPNEDERAWIAQNLVSARAIVANHTKDASEDLKLGSLEEALSMWSSRAHPDRVDPNTFVNTVGIAFGQVLVDRLGLKWAVVTDERGTDVAVHGSPGDILAFPISAVAKRVADGETAFLIELYRRLAADIGKIRGHAH